MTRTALSIGSRFLLAATHLVALWATLSAAGCIAVKPYQREVLSLRSMQGASEKSEDKFRQHWAESREGPGGGFASAGGGCGCN